MQKLVLFDLDGTLISTHGAGLRAMARAGRTLWGDAFGFEGIQAAGGLDPALLALAAQQAGVTVNDADHQRFMAEYARVLPLELQNGHTPKVLPGVRELLAAMDAHEAVTLGLLTGNYRCTAPLKLRAVEIDVARFAVQVYGDEASTRPALVPLGIERWREVCAEASADACDVAIIGDTPRDIEAARAHGCTAIGVATGPYDVETLEAAGADLAVADLSDTKLIWRALKL